VPRPPLAHRAGGEKLKTPEARDVVRRFLDAAFVRKDFEGLDDLMANEGLKTAARGFVAAFPDLEMKFEHEIAEGDVVGVRVSATGTHLGPFRGYPPSGKKWQATASAWYQVQDGRIVNAWINWDWLAIMEAIGVVSWKKAANDVAGTVQRHP
jgi:predicted ester cyclase